MKHSKSKILFALSIYIVSVFSYSNAIIAQDSTIIQPAIKSVIVYPDRAIIKREQLITVKKGNQTLIFKSASPVLNPRSLTAYCNNKNVVIRSINTYTEKQNSSLDPEIKRLEEKIDLVNQKRALLQLEKKRTQTDLSGVNNYLKYLKESINQNSLEKSNNQFDSWKKAQSFLSKRRLSIVQQKMGIDQKLQKNQLKINFLKSNLNKIKTQQSKVRRIIEIQIQANTNTRTTIGLSYMMNNISWNVSYGMYLSKGKLKVDYYGNIVQQSGEDWNNIKIGLSTTNPAKGISRKKISPILVYARKVETQTQYINTEEKVSEDEGESNIADSIANNTSQQQVKGLEPILFRVPGKVSIKSGKRSIRVKISSFSIKPKDYYFRVIPSLNKTAQYTIKTNNTQDFPLLAGSIDLFRKSGFVGKTRLQHTVPGSSFQISFGNDRRISVERDLSHKQIQEGILNSQKAFITDSTAWLGNESQQPLKIEYYERIPVSQTEDIKVIILDKTTPSYKSIRKNSGILKWSQILRPGQKIKIRLQYKVLVPENYSGSIYGR